MSDTIYFPLLGASLLAWVGRQPMTRKKRSSAGRGRLSIDVGQMKVNIVEAADMFGISVSELIRDALRFYSRREDRQVSGYQLSELLLLLWVLEQAFIKVRNNPADPTAQKEFQEALDEVQYAAGFLRRRIPR